MSLILIRHYKTLNVGFIARSYKLVHASMMLTSVTVVFVSIVLIKLYKSEVWYNNPFYWFHMLHDIMGLLMLLVLMF